LQASYLEEPAEAIVLETTTNLAYDLVEHIKKERKAKQLWNNLQHKKNMMCFYSKLGCIHYPHQNQGLSIG